MSLKKEETEMTSRLPRLKDEHAFEELVVALLPSLVSGVRHGDAQAVAGRGYRQYGIDIYCPLAQVAVQCKNTAAFTAAHVEADLAKSRYLNIPISHFIFATAADNSDVGHRITAQLQAETRFTREVIYWSEIQEAALAQPGILSRFWPDLHAIFARATANQESAMRVRAEAPLILGPAVSPQFIDSLARYDFSGGLSDYQFNEVVELYQLLGQAGDRMRSRAGLGTAEPASGLTDALIRELEPFMAILKPFALAIRDTQTIRKLPGDHYIIALRDAYVSFVVHTWHNNNPELMYRVGS